jgi:hypothetical protein
VKSIEAMRKRRSAAAADQAATTELAKASDPAKSAGSPWTPPSYRTFQMLWLAQLGSNVGSWMQTVATQWLLIDRNASLIALVQTASCRCSSSPCRRACSPTPSTAGNS